MGLSAILVGLLLMSGCSKSDGKASSSGSSEGTATVSGTQSDGNSSSDGKLSIVTTCGMVTDIVRTVAGERAVVEGLIGTTQDPHMFTAGRNDVHRMLNADFVFYSGLMLEGRMGDEFARVGRKGKPVFPVTEGLDREKLREPPEFEGHWDPHVWMDASLWSECAATVAAQLSEFDAESSAVYETNVEAYRDKLAGLDKYISQVVSSIPVEHRYLVTAHDAFGYFSDAYGIEVKAIQGISTDSQASVADINELVDFIVDRKVPAIFVESSVSKKNIEAVIEGCRVRGWTLKIGAELFSDAMGDPGTYEGTYIGMMDHNATRIARALGGEAPERGWQGKLAEAESTEY